MNLVKLRCDTCGEICNFDADSGKKGVICKSCGGKVYYRPENIVPDEPPMQQMPEMEMQPDPQMGYAQQEQPMYDNYEAPEMQQNMGMPPQMEAPQMPPTVQPRGKRNRNTAPQGMPMNQPEAPMPNRRQQNMGQKPVATPKQGGGIVPVVACILIIVFGALSVLSITKVNKVVTEMDKKLDDLTQIVQSQSIGQPVAPAPAADMSGVTQPTDTAIPADQSGQASDVYDTYQETGAELPATTDLTGGLTSDPDAQLIDNSMPTEGGE